MRRKIFNKTYLVLLIIIVLLRTACFTQNNILSGKVKYISSQAASCSIQIDNSINNIEAVQYGKRIWEAFGEAFFPISFFARYISIREIFFAFIFYRIIDLREYLLRLITVYFHGSKYKDGGLPSAI